MMPVRAFTPSCADWRQLPLRTRDRDAAAQNFCQKFNIARSRDHAVADIALGDQACLICHPPRHERRHALLKAAGIVAAMGNRAAEHFRADRDNVQTRQSIRADEVDRLDRRLARRPAPDRDGSIRSSPPRRYRARRPWLHLSRRSASDRRREPKRRPSRSRRSKLVFRPYS